MIWKDIKKHIPDVEKFIIAEKINPTGEWLQNVVKMAPGGKILVTWNHDEYRIDADNPTYWRPLPTPPEKAEEAWNRRDGV